MTNNKLKILFIGEYSGVFTQLIKSLKRKNIDCFIISNGDGYKSYPTDILFINKQHSTKNILIRIFRNLLFRFGLQGLFIFIKNWNNIKQYIKGYDIVQLINPYPLSGFGSVPNLIFVRYLKKNNKNIFLSTLGDDYYVNKWMSKNYPRSNFYKDNYNVFNYILPKNGLLYKYSFLYKYLNNYVIKISNSIIPGLNCYKKAYEWTNKTTRVIPFPLDKSMIGNPIKLKDKEVIEIFHGWQIGRESSKGNDIFDKVLKKIKLKYGEQIKYTVIKSRPFSEYIKLFSSAHIFIDQLYSDDKGVNGLLGMAAGKVVFSGFDMDSLNSYPNYNGELIGIDSINNEEYLFEKFSELIDSPQKIEEISYNAINFVKNNHDSDYISNLYLEEWSKYLK